MRRRARAPLSLPLPLVDPMRPVPSASELGAWVSKYGWTDEGSTIFIRNQDESVKTKNIREKVDFETVAGLMASSK